MSLVILKTNNILLENKLGILLPTGKICLVHSEEEIKVNFQPVVWLDEFRDLCIKNKVKQKKDRLALLEAYRRYMVFNTDNKPLNTAWVGLGVPSKYSREYFYPVEGKAIPRICCWWKLTTKGFEILSNILINLPIPETNIEKDKLNEVLFEISYYGFTPQRF